MHLEQSKQVLRNADLFADLNEIHLDLVLMVCEEVTYADGAVIFRQDSSGDALYIIASGEVQVVLEPEQEAAAPVELAVLKPYETFGETILVEEGHRTATARCLTQTTLLRLPRGRVVRLTNDYPEIGFRIMRRMAADLTRKLSQANESLRRQLG
ncbi:MAG: cyclic nucleotide-binding domain-containing protein [Anaerolineae bacterium]|nr:cyclic nucleotide-binding domain-containing protein [Anaerolineae bacterium]